MSMSLKVFTTLVIALALTAIARANLINISMNPITGQPAADVDKGYFGNNSPTTNFNGLLQEISLYNTFNGTNLLAPTMAGFFDSSSNTVNLTGFDYAVVHYGRGPAGQGQGGGIEFFYLNGMTGNYTFSTSGLGTNGFGGFSSIRLFSVNGFSTAEDDEDAMLLAVTALGLFTIRRFVRA
jgi:hypothetical protein